MTDSSVLARGNTAASTARATHTTALAAKCVASRRLEVTCHPRCRVTPPCVDLSECQRRTYCAMPSSVECSAAGSALVSALISARPNARHRGKTVRLASVRRPGRREWDTTSCIPRHLVRGATGTACPRTMVNKEMAALWAFAQARNDPSCGDIADEVVSEPFVVPLPIERAGRRDGSLLLTSQLLRPGEVRHPRATCTGKYVHGRTSCGSVQLHFPPEP